MLRKIVAWVKSHKAGLGTGATFVCAGLAATGHKQWAEGLALAATYLIGAGVHPSDRAVKEFDNPR